MVQSIHKKGSDMSNEEVPTTPNDESCCDFCNKKLETNATSLCYACFHKSMELLSPMKVQVTKDSAIRKYTRTVNDETLVGVLRSLTYGSGWSTWAPEYSRNMIFDYDIISFIVRNSKNECTNSLSYEDLRLLNALINQKYPSFVTMPTYLTVDWVPMGSTFRIEEYDGAESIRYFKQYSWEIA